MIAIRVIEPHTRGMTLAYAAEEEPEPIYIYRSVNRDGATYSLEAGSSLRFRERLGSTVHARGRVFLQHETEDEYTRLYGDVASQVIPLLTGVSEQRLKEVFGAPVIFLDARTEEEIPRQTR